MSRPVPTTRADYPHFLSIDTRWSDNDLYGHVNNVVYYSYFASLAFPQRIDAGLRVARIGSTSVRYEVGIFSAGSEQPAAQGYFVHVYVDRDARRPVALPETLVAALKPLVNVVTG